ncbi:MAG TPA: DUF4331 domain-containing protein [Gaiellaceae bacterium]|nr:DUF4331 domain-containing protein [Gaiellaceae bacterium]
MKKYVLAAAALGAVSAAALGAAFVGSGPSASTASSHREAPLISEDPSADNTDVYAFRSPDKPDTVTIISNWIPAEDPAAGPMYWEFSSRARYNIHIDTTGDGRADIVYRARFRQSTPVAFLRSTRQPFTITREQGGRSRLVAQGTTPPNNIGPRTTPNYRSLAAAGVVNVAGGGLAFAGQREDAFFGDIGAIFDTLAFRRFPGNAGGGKDFFAGYAVHTISLQIPIADLGARNNIIGVWSTTDRLALKVRTVKAKQLVRVKGKIRNKVVKRKVVSTRFVQVSRLGNPLVNEVLIPTNRKDEWNRGTPRDDGTKFGVFYREPILAALINQVYPGVVNAPERNRDDIEAIFLTGLPNLNNTGPIRAEMLRLNLGIAPTAPVGRGNRLGVVGGDNAGFPNGRRLEDDVIDIAEKAVAGALKGNNTALLLGDGVDTNDQPFMTSFPYQGDPFSGFENTKGQQRP